MEGLSDEILVERCRRNDHAAFTLLVDRYKSRVYWLVKRMVGPGEAEDLTQEVFIRVYKALPRFRAESSFSTWIYKIARNLSLSELRKRGNRGEHLSWEEEGEEKVHHLLPENPDGGLERRIERLHISRAVRSLIEKLPERQKTALTLHYLHQVRYEEIAEIMGVPMGTVKTWLHRGRLRLREQILAGEDREGIAGDHWRSAARKGEKR